MDKPMKLVIAIMNDDQSYALSKALRGISTLGSSIVLGTGTISDKILQFLGFDSSEKDILFTLVDEENEQLLYDLLDKKFKINKPHKGVVFSIPLTRLAYWKKRIVDEYRIIKEDRDMAFQAIIAITNHETAEETIDAAKQAGATGATVIHARGMVDPDHPKLFGMEIEPEKDMVLILAGDHKADAIMDAIHAQHSMHEHNSGVVFSMDISRAMGLLQQQK